MLPLPLGVGGSGKDEFYDICAVGFFQCLTLLSNTVFGV